MEFHSRRAVADVRRLEGPYSDAHVRHTSNLALVGLHYKAMRDRAGLGWRYNIDEFKTLKVPVIAV